MHDAFVVVIAYIWSCVYAMDCQAFVCCFRKWNVPVLYMCVCISLKEKKKPLAFKHLLSVMYKISNKPWHSCMDSINDWRRACWSIGICMYLCEGFCECVIVRTNKWLLCAPASCRFALIFQRLMALSCKTSKPVINWFSWEAESQKKKWKN